MEPTSSHLGMRVSDLERAVRFSCDPLGFERAVSQSIGIAF
jgi:catechol 2,3-dioxygenase-like lactoylglutathione lyase family enzyme